MSVVIRGKLTVKVYGMLKQKQLSGNWAIMYDGGGKGSNPPCIELFEKQSSAAPVHTIILEHLKFSDKSYRHTDMSFMLSIKKEKHVFEFENLEEKEDWVQSLCHVSQELWKQRASAKESSEFEESEVSKDMCDNMLYDSFDRVQQYKVSINPNKASEANNLRGHYMLNPTKDSLRLLEIDSPKIVHEWAYRQIRKFGNTRRIFRMEVGRRCTTGAGEFEFFTPDGSTLAKLITEYTRQMYHQESRQPQAEVVSSPPCEEGDYVESLIPSRNSSVSNPSPQRSPVARVSSQVSRNSRYSREDDSRVSERGSTSSLEAKRDMPIPVPRSTVKSRKENGAASVKNGHSSGDTKIYETSSGLTAPLDSKLKHELHSKFQVQPPDLQEASSQGSCTVIEDDPSSDAIETSTDMHGSTESVKNKKKSEKERKKQEKEQKAAEVKLKKQQEKEEKQRAKELKEQKEREAKEEKERQKKMKKESKTHEKLKSKKSLDIPAPTPAPLLDGNIYDEPGDLMAVNKPASSPPVESEYSDADNVATVLAKLPTSASQAEEDCAYATPQKPKKDSWRTHARPESEHIHQENYNSIKQASLSHSKSRHPPVPPFPPHSKSLPTEDDVEDTYNRLGDFRPSVHPPENVYGMASAKETVSQTRQAAPPPVSAFAGGNEYEDADAVCPGLLPAQDAQ